MKIFLLPSHIASKGCERNSFYLAAALADEIVLLLQLHPYSSIGALLVIF